MRLSKNEVEWFYKLYHSLLVYVNKKFRIIRGIQSVDDLRKLPIAKINNIREQLYKHPELISSFVNKNISNFSAWELKTISDWRNFVKGKFLVFRYLKDYTIFLDPDEPPKAYGVLALNTPFEVMFGPNLPIMVEAVLLPFKRGIIYDSIFSTYRITFGAGIRRSLNESYQQAKARFGIITSLPFSLKEIEQTDADMLKFYLKSKHNREIYWEEIEKLIDKDLNLLILYHQEMDKINARNYGKHLRKIGLSKIWFAILEGIIIASGATRDEVERVLYHILPPEKRKFVYIFQLK